MLEETIGGSNLEIYALIALAAVELFRRIAQVTPGKKDDEIANKMELWARKLTDFLAGNHGKPGDTGTMKPETAPAPSKKLG